MDAQRKKIKRKRRSTWSANAETVLLKLWGEKLKQLKACRKNMHVYEEMARQLSAQGHPFNKFEVKIKIHNLTNRFRDERKKIGALGATDWEHFTTVNKIIGALKPMKVEGLVEENTDEYEVPMKVQASNFMTTSQELCTSASTSESEPVNKKAQKMSTFQKEALRELKDSNNKYKTDLSDIKTAVQEQTSAFLNEILEVEKRRNNILESFLEAYKEKNKNS